MFTRVPHVDNAAVNIFIARADRQRTLGRTVRPLELDTIIPTCPSGSAETNFISSSGVSAAQPRLLFHFCQADGYGKQTKSLSLWLPLTLAWLLARTDILTDVNRPFGYPSAAVRSVFSPRSVFKNRFIYHQVWALNHDPPPACPTEDNKMHVIDGVRGTAGLLPGLRKQVY